MHPHTYVLTWRPNVPETHHASISLSSSYTCISYWAQTCTINAAENCIGGAFKSLMARQGFSMSS